MLNVLNDDNLTKFIPNTILDRASGDKIIFLGSMRTMGIVRGGEQKKLGEGDKI